MVRGPGTTHTAFQRIGGMPRLRAEHRSQLAVVTLMGRPVLPAARHLLRGSPMDLLTWIIVGLVAGLLASAVVGGIGYGLLGDIVVGMVGAVLGGWLFSTLGISLPVPGLAGTILVAFIGAVVLLLLIRAV